MQQGDTASIHERCQNDSRVQGRAAVRRLFSHGVELEMIASRDTCVEIIQDFNKKCHICRYTVFIL